MKYVTITVISLFILAVSSLCIASTVEQRIDDFQWGLKIVSPDFTISKFTKNGKLTITTSKLIEDIVNEVADHSHGIAKKNMDLPKKTEILEVKDWARGLDVDFSQWIISYIITKDGRMFLVYLELEKTKINPIMLDCWEITHN